MFLYRKGCGGRSHRVCCCRGGRRCCHRGRAGLFLLGPAAFLLHLALALGPFLF